MREQKDIASTFLKTMNISNFKTPAEFANEQPEQEILYTWKGDVLHEDE